MIQVSYDRVARVVVTNNCFLNSAAKSVPHQASITDSWSASNAAAESNRLTGIASPTGRGHWAPPALPPNARYGVYVGDSAVQLVISNNSFFGISVQAMQINSTGAIQGDGNISITNNIIDCANLGTGIWFRRVDGISIQGNVVTRATDNTPKTPGIMASDGITNSLVVNNLCSKTAV